MDSWVCSAAICLGSSFRATYSKKPIDLKKKADSVLGTSLETLKLIYSKQELPVWNKFQTRAAQDNGRYYTPSTLHSDQTNNEKQKCVQSEASSVLV